MRIVSLLPSATEIACELGLQDDIVGVSHECDYPGIGSRPIVTNSDVDSSKESHEIDRDVRSILDKGLSIFGIDDKLFELRPDIILTQDQCDACAVSPRDLQAAAKELCGAKVISLSPSSMQGMLDDIRRIGKETGREKEAEALVGDLDERIGKALAEHPRARPKVCCIEWLDPLIISGNWVPGIVRMAGAENILTKEGDYSGVFDLKDVLKAKPDKLIVAPCGFDTDRTKEELHKLTSRKEWKRLKAVKEKEVYLVDGKNYLNRPSHKLVDTLEIVSSIVRPDYSEKEDLAFRH